MRTSPPFLVLIPLIAFAEPPSLQESSLYGASALAAQFQALQRSPDIDVTYRRSGRVQQVRGPTGVVIPTHRTLQPGDPADLLMKQLAPILMATKDDGLRVEEVRDRSLMGPEGRESNIHGYYVFMQQTIGGIPVMDGRVNIQTNKSGEVGFIGSTFVPSIKVDRTPALTLDATKKKVMDGLSGVLTVRGSVSVSEGGSLAYFTDEGQLDTPVLVWVFHASYKQYFSNTEQIEVTADASTGKIRYRRSMVFFN